MSKTQFSKDQPVDFRLDADGMWWHGGRYMHLVPGPASEDPWVRVRSKAGSALAVRLSDVRPQASTTPLADALAVVDQAAADGFAPDGTARRPLVTALWQLSEAVREHLMWCQELRQS